MSVFGLFKRGRQAAKEHKAGLAQKQKAEEQKPAYRHVPTHAAVDALAGAPASWRDQDRPRIVEENRRRSAMATSAMGHYTPQSPLVHQGLPRVNSSLSHVSYPSAYANPVVSTSRANSFTGSVRQSWGDRGAVEVVYSSPKDPIFKGKAVERPVSLSAVRHLPSKVDSSSDSTSSDDLEMRPVRHHQTTVPLQTSDNGIVSPTAPELSPGRPKSSDSQAHRLHPSKGRKSPASSVTAKDRYYPPRAGQGFRVTVHRTGSAPAEPALDVPPVPSLPSPRSLKPPAPSHSASSSSSSGRTSVNFSAPTKLALKAGPDSPVSPTTPSLSGPVSPAAATASAVKASEFDFEFSSTYTAPEPTSPRAFSLVQPRSPSAKGSSSRRASSDFPPYQEKPDDVSMAPPPPVSMHTRSRDLPRASYTPRTLPVDFNDTVLSQAPREVPAPHPEPAPSVNQKVGRGRLTKTPQGAKPAKSSRRWSFSKSTPPAMAG